MTDLIHLFFRISDVSVTGLKIWVPLLFLLFIFKILKKPLINSFIFSANIIVLSTGVLFTIAFIADTFLAFTTEGADRAGFIKSVLSGPHWYQYLIPVVNYAILPHLEWSSRMRQSIYSSLAIVSSWIISFVVIYDITRSERTSLMGRTIMPEIDWSGSVLDFIYVASFSVLISIILQLKSKTH